MIIVNACCHCLMWRDTCTEQNTHNAIETAIPYIICLMNNKCDNRHPNTTAAIFDSLPNPLTHSHVILRHRTWYILTRVMFCCLTTPSHYLNQCWLIDKGLVASIPLQVYRKAYMKIVLWDSHPYPQHACYILLRFGQGLSWILGSANERRRYIVRSSLIC